MNILSLVKKVSIAIVSTIFLLVAGLFIFVTTQGDYILEQISLIVEEATGSPLITESLPSIGFSPMPNINIYKSSWGNEDMSVAFDSASMHFSILKLLSGEIDISEVALHSPHIYIDASKAVSTQTQQEPISDEEEIVSDDSLEVLLAPVPKNVILSNAYIEYKDKDQHLIMENLNINVSNFAVNNNASMTMGSAVSYTMFADKSKYVFDFDLTQNFLLTNETFDFNMSSMQLIAKEGFGFRDTMTISAKSLVNLETFAMQNLSSTVKSSFMNMNFAQKGEFNLDNMNMSVNASIYPKSMVKIFGIDQYLPASQEFNTMTLKTDLSYKNDVATISNLIMNYAGIDFNSSIVFDMREDTLSGDFSLANLVVDNFFPPSTNEASTQNTQSTQSTASPIYMPDMLAKTTFNLDMKMNNIKYDTIVLNSFSTRMTGSNSRLLMNAINMTVLGSAMTASLDLDLTKNQHARTSMKIPSLDIGTYAKALMDMNGLTGTMSLDTSLSFSVLDPMANLNGSGEVVFAKLGVKSSSLPTLAKILKEAKRADEDFEFAGGKVPYTITNSVFKMNNAYLNSSKYYVSTNGTVNLKNDALNLEVRAGSGEKSTIPLTIKGTMSDPKVTITLENALDAVKNVVDSVIDTEALKNEAAKKAEELNTKVTEEVNKGVENLTNKVNEEINKSADKLLNSILKR